MYVEEMLIDGCSCEHSVSTYMSTSITHQCKSYRWTLLKRIPNMQSEDTITKDKPFMRHLPIVKGIVNVNISDTHLKSSVTDTTIYTHSVGGKQGRKQQTKYPK